MLLERRAAVLGHKAVHLGGQRAGEIVEIIRSMRGDEDRELFLRGLSLMFVEVMGVVMIGMGDGVL